MRPHPARNTALATLVALAGSVSTMEAQAVQPAAAVVTRPYSLLRHGTPGTSTSYRLSRVNRMVDRRGRVMNVTEAHAVVDRRLVAEVEPGVWTEDFVWRAFRLGESPELPAPGAAPLLRQRIDPRSEELLDTARAVPGLESEAELLFRVLVLDAWTWDAVVHDLRLAAGPEVRLGREFHMPGWDSARAIPLSGDAVVHYRLAPIHARADGVTLCGEEPCLRVAFRVEGNEVTQHMGPVSIDGIESFRGAAYLSLRDGHLIRGEFWGPLLATMTTNPGTAPLATSGFMTEVVMEEVVAGR